MVSDEQRRKIAENLRSESEAWSDTFPDSTLNDEDNDAIMFDISRFVLFEGTPTVGEFYARLADLIDRPTCRKVIPSEMEGYVFCSRCGAEIGEYSVPSYCHNCGAEVMDE